MMALAVICSLGENIVFANIAEVSVIEVSNESDFIFSNGTITGYKGFDANVVIPYSINGEPVTSINNYTSFSKDSPVISITIPYIDL